MTPRHRDRRRIALGAIALGLYLLGAAGHMPPAKAAEPPDTAERTRVRAHRALEVIEAIPVDEESRRLTFAHAATRDCRGYLSLPQDVGKGRTWPSANRVKLGHIAAVCAVIAGEAGAAHLLYRWADLAESFDPEVTAGRASTPSGDGALSLAEKLDRMRRTYGSTPLGRAIIHWHAKHNPPRLEAVEALTDARTRAMLAYVNRALLETPRGRTQITAWLPSGRYRHVDEQGELELDGQARTMPDLEVKPLAVGDSADYLAALCAVDGGTEGRSAEASLVSELMSPPPPTPKDRAREALGWGALGLAAVTVGLSIADGAIGAERKTRTSRSDLERFGRAGSAVRATWITTGALSLAAGSGWLAMTILRDPNEEDRDEP